ncbi:hypothetical protein [Mangrovicella endophytica]|uniref:hypothetical protein n=1 Tax=Mangrovicella endophytica TaxID=2066697 RepID=UPI0012FFD35B|nr:hypothetical protein [Mangrovicella endophytica]
MSEAGPIVFRIDSEDSAWEALDWLIRNRAEARHARLDLSDLSWTRVHLNFKGKPFEQTVTSSIMKGVVEFQNDLYRSLSLILKDDERITRLTDAEKSKSELIFKVDKGSSDLDAQAGDQLGLLQIAVEKMSGRQVLIAVLTLLVLYFGYHGVDSYFEHKVEEKRVEAEEKGRQFDIQERKDLYDFVQKIIKSNPDRNRIINNAFRASPTAATIGEHNRHGFDEVIRNSAAAEQLTIQGTSLSSGVISEIRRSNRATSEEVVIKDLFRVVGVDSDNPESYTVHLENEDASQTIVAQLDDPLIQSRYQKAIQRSEWSDSLVMVHLTARRVGGMIKDAKITRAYAPRKPRSKRAVR